ncbi:MAG TPA: AraC family transcriptional regulator [Planctomycetota bacterium]|nr:AraC family transcriptional regulator [Planctomycetota bacterium]
MAAKLSRSAAQELRDQIFKAAPGLEAAEMLFDSVNDVIFCVKDRERRYVAANFAFVRSAGLKNRADLLGRTAREVFPKLLAAGYEQQDDEVFEHGAFVRDRLEMVTRANGDIGWFVSQKVPVRGGASAEKGGKSAAPPIIALAGISRDLSVPAAEEARIGPLAEALDRLHRDYALPLRIGEIARKTGLSWSQFQRRVTALTGLSPRQLLTKSRIEAAARALNSTDRPIARIAIDCGFYDQAAFSRQFRSFTGHSPCDYRKAARTNAE